MSRTAVVICPGRGTYNKTELGYLHKHHSRRSAELGVFDAIRSEAGQDSVTALDGAARFSVSKYSRGDVASPLIFASSVLDAQALADDIEIVAVTGNSMGWYSALTVGGALSPESGFRVSNTMGTLMQQHLIGGQLVYPAMDENWRYSPEAATALLAEVDRINGLPDHRLGLSIDLGGLLVLAGNEAGLAAFEASQPAAHGRFPMRLANHAAFHTDLQAPVAAEGRSRLGVGLFEQPKHPLIDGRGAIWWPGASNLSALWNYTLGHQVNEAYDFTRAVQTAAREFAPDLFIIAGPGTTLGGAVAQSLIRTRWRGMQDKGNFAALQDSSPFLISMGRDDQRYLVS